MKMDISDTNKTNKNAVDAPDFPATPHSNISASYCNVLDCPATDACLVKGQQAFCVHQDQMHQM